MPRARILLWLIGLLLLAGYDTFDAGDSTNNARHDLGPNVNETSDSAHNNW